MPAQADPLESADPGPAAKNRPAAGSDVIETDIPHRMDRLPWSGWHHRILLALGTSWLLDGLEAAGRSLESVSKPLQSS